MHFSLVRGVGIAVAFSLFATPASAQLEIRKVMQNNVPVQGDFMLGPTRLSFSLAPGEEETTMLEVTNRQGETASFQIVTEDFSAGSTPEEATKLYGAESGPFPARSWLVPASQTFSLRHGERALVPVTVRVPVDALPGDHYAAVLINRLMTDEEGADQGFAILSRVGTLFLISVEGDVIQKGDLTQLRTGRTVYGTYPIDLHLTGQNEGTVYMTPIGTIDIKNLLGFVVDQIPVKDWVILRNSTRTLRLDWQPRFALGYYTATAHLKIGDESLTVVQDSFWVLPIVPILLALICIFLVSFLVQFGFSRFEIRRKS